MRSTIVVPVSAADLSARMKEMRLWLDKNGVQPSLFSYEPTDDDVAAVSVVFEDQAAAEAFRTAFAGVSPN